jgi:hypothetical protein
MDSCFSETCSNLSEILGHHSTTCVDLIFVIYEQGLTANSFRRVEIQQTSRAVQFSIIR